MKKLQCIVVILLAASTAHADAPAWCKTPGVEKPFHLAGVDTALSPNPQAALPALVETSCWPEGDAAGKTKEIEQARAKWSKTFELTDADWADVAIWAMKPD